MAGKFVAARQGAREEMQLQHAVAYAALTAQNDGGVVSHTC